MVSRIKALLPAAVEPLAIGAWYLFRPIVRVAFFGRARYCPVCESRCRRFLTHGRPSRRVQDAVCPVCLSHPRLRLAWLFLSTRTDLLDGRPKRILHVAPEPALTQLFQGDAWELGRNIHPHPTLSEAVMEAAMAVDGHAIHI